MAYKDVESRFESDYPTENDYRRQGNDFRTFDGDSANDRMSQHNQAGNWYERDERRRNASSQHRSTQDFQNENARRFNRGREGDGMWRSGEYGPSEYREDFGRPGYGERYGFSGYGRSRYDPDINRGWQEEYPTWHEGAPFNDREQDYRGGRWNQGSRGYSQDYFEGNNGRGGYNPGRYGDRDFGWNQGNSYGRGNQEQYSDRNNSWNSENREYSGMQGGRSFERGIPSGMEEFGGRSNWGGMQSNRGRYAGIGPKNYKRSDERIEEEVSERLTTHGDMDPSNIEVKVSQGEVILTGDVEDRRMKRLAEDIAEEVSGVKNVNNQIHVRDQARKSMSMSENGHSENGHSKRSRS